VGVCEGFGVEVGVGETEGAGFVTLMPLLQTNFLLTFMQVYLNPEITTSALTFVHGKPDLTAAEESGA